MPSSSGSSAQFQHSNLDLGDYDDFQYKNHQTGDSNPTHQGVLEVTPLMAANLSTASRQTAWRLRRDGTALPQPLSKENAGSIYNWNTKSE
jgi:hypothetical protein